MSLKPKELPFFLRKIIGKSKREGESWISRNIRNCPDTIYPVEEALSSKYQYVSKRRQRESWIFRNIKNCPNTIYPVKEALSSEYQYVSKRRERERESLGYLETSKTVLIRSTRLRKLYQPNINMYLKEEREGGSERERGGERERERESWISRNIKNCPDTIYPVEEALSAEYQYVSKRRQRES